MYKLRGNLNRKLYQMPLPTGCKTSPKTDQTNNHNFPVFNTVNFCSQESTIQPSAYKSSQPPSTSAYLHSAPTFDSIIANGENNSQPVVTQLILSLNELSKNFFKGSGNVKVALIALMYIFSLLLYNHVQY